MGGDFYTVRNIVRSRNSSLKSKPFVNFSLGAPRTQADISCSRRLKIVLVLEKSNKKGATYTPRGTVRRAKYTRPAKAICIAAIVYAMLVRVEVLPGRYN